VDNHNHEFYRTEGRWDCACGACFWFDAKGVLNISGGTFSFLDVAPALVEAGATLKGMAREKTTIVMNKPLAIKMHDA
jgi:hypothetical protein